MILHNYFLIVILAIISFFGKTLANRNFHDLKCWNRNHICDDMKSLKIEVDVNTADRRKWNQHYHFLRRFHDTWESEINDAVERKLEDRLKSKLKEIDELVLKTQEQNIELQRKMSSIETRLREADDRAESLESELRKEREAHNLIEIKLKETTENIQHFVASQTDTEDALKDISSSFENLRRTVETPLTTLRKDFANVSYVSNLYNLTDAKLQSMTDEHMEDFRTLEDTLKIHNAEIENLNTQLLRVETVCSPPCENGGKCLKNVCNCPTWFTGDGCKTAVCSPPCENGGSCTINNTCYCSSLFTGDRCQNVLCSPPCENGGKCSENNVCNCTSAFTGNRCQNELQCGLDFDRVHGNYSSTLVFPWMAALFENQSYYCDGSLIHPRFVLTSAGCMYYGTRKRMNYEVTVKLGFTDLKNQTHLQERKVRTIHFHPEYKRALSGKYDIALLELDKPIEYSYYLRPICLPSKEIYDDSSFFKPQSIVRTITLNGLIIADYLKNKDLIIQPPDICREVTTQRRWATHFHSNSTFCADVIDLADFTCDLMDGTPVMQSHLGERETRIWTQVGITIAKCYGKEKQLFASNVQQFMPWINATIEASSKQ